MDCRSAAEALFATPLSVVLLLAGCSDRLEPPPDSCTPGQELEVTVSSDPIPLFTWFPACGLSSLDVWDQNHTSGWVLFTGSRSAENPLRSGIRYGNAPAQALEPEPARRLVSGTSYTVRLYRWNGDASGFHEEVGSATFER